MVTGATAHPAFAGPASRKGLHLGPYVINPAVQAGPGRSLGPEQLPATLNSGLRGREPWSRGGSWGWEVGGGGGTPSSSAALLPLTATGFISCAPYLESNPARIVVEPFSLGKLTSAG